MFTTANTNLTHLVAESVHKFAKPLTGADNDYEALLALIGDARFVLSGEASHGTHEFYRERAQLTQRLINEKGFNAGAVEAVAGLFAPRLERASGVVYRPESERRSHYFWARRPQQFDALLFFDETQAVEPLERTPEGERGKVPETFPTGS